jgi:outer membrane PBP1 activator LpoA protein
MPEQSRKANVSNPSSSAPRVIKAEERRTEAMRLRISGLTYRQIADELNCTVSTAHDLVMTELRQAREEASETREELRQIELDRLDGLQAAYYSAALEGDAQAAELCLKIAKHRASLVGIESPKEIHATIDVRVAHLVSAALFRVEEEIMARLSAECPDAETERLVLEHLSDVRRLLPQYLEEQAAEEAEE